MVSIRLLMQRSYHTVAVAGASFLSRSSPMPGGGMGGVIDGGCGLQWRIVVSLNTTRRRTLNSVMTGVRRLIYLRRSVFCPEV